MTKELNIGDVTIKDAPTPKGQRMEIKTPSDEITLDAVQIESVAWQRRDELTDFLDVPKDADQHVVGSEPTTTGPSLTISNEYTQVIITNQETNVGDRLKIESVKLGYVSYMGENLLSGIAEMKSKEFRSLLEQPFGPGNKETH